MLIRKYYVSISWSRSRQLHLKSAFQGSISNKLTWKVYQSVKLLHLWSKHSFHSGKLFANWQCWQLGPRGAVWSFRMWAHGVRCPLAVAGCKLRRSFVKLEKSVQLAGVESKCYSTEPVLRCNKGCSATRTAPVTVGFHCLPAGESTEILLKGSWAKV